MYGIIWLASYPKSGNTWLRAFLANYFRNPDRPVPINELPHFAIGDGFYVHYEQVSGKKASELTEEEIRALRPKVHQWFATGGGETVFVKTHNYVGHEEGQPLITPAATAGAIYVVRNPIDVAVSFAHHYQVSYDRAVELMCTKNNVMPGSDKLRPAFLGDWTQHVRSWTEAPGLTRHVMRYEDMQRKPGPTFRALVKFLGLPGSANRLRKAIRFSSFRELQRQEQQHSFVEARPDGSTPFFREGRGGIGRETLTREQIDRLVEAHGEAMRRFGYLDRQSRPTG